MKFGRYLQENSIEEWQRGYINYRLLKKAIVRAEAELHDLDEESDEGATVVGDGGGEGEGTGGDLEVGTMRRTASPTALTPQHSGASSVAPSNDGGPVRADTATQDTNSPLDTTPRTPTAGFIRHLSFRRPTLALSSPSSKSNKWRGGFPATLTREQLEIQLPDSCKRFFVILDRELERVQGFYGEREENAVKQFQELSSQWMELRRHKAEFQAYKSREMSAHGPKSMSPIVVASFSIPGSGVVRRTLARGHHSEGDPASTPPSAVHGRPEDYTAARSKLKLATFEFYRGLGLLKSYRVLNRTGFAKALKKFEKSTMIPCVAAYSPVLDRSNFVHSSVLDDLISQTENAFTTVFEHGDRKKAMARLRLGGAPQSHHFSSWRSGMYIGAGIVFLIEGCVKSAQAETHVSIPYWTALLQLFGAILLPILFTLLFYLNLVAWHFARINYVLIFELDIRNRIDYRQFLELPALLFFIFSLFFWAAFNNFFPNHIPPSSYPLAFIVIALTLLLSPAPYINPSARWWMIRSFLRVITAGLMRVQFRDFFIGDELNSLYYTFYNLGFLYCTYSHHWGPDVQEICSTNSTWTSAVLAALPAFFRFGQSIRRYMEETPSAQAGTGMRFSIHIVNAGKYTSVIAYFFFYFNWRINGSPHDWRMALWLVSAVITSSYTITWDLFFDWSLGRRGSKHLFLRPELGFKDYAWVYYVSVVVDVCLRLTWIIYIPTQIYPSVQLRGFIVALLEVFRRILWNTFRVESEHIGNVDGYRVTRNVPLPYIIPLPHDDATPDERIEGTTTRERVYSFFHNLHQGLVEDFLPLSSLHLPNLGGGRGGKKRMGSKKEFTRRGSMGGGGESSTPASDDGEPEERSDDEGGDEVDDGEVEGGMREARRIISGGEEGKVKSIEEGGR